MEISSVAKRYAQALYDYASGENALDQVRTDCLAISQLIGESRDFAEFIENPTIPPDVADNAITALFKEEAHPVTLQFIRFLGTKSRMDQLGGICEVLEQRICDDTGILKVKITAAHALSDKQTAALQKRLGERYGKKIEADVSVDPSLIGGFKIQVGDQIQDYSIVTKLDKFEQGVIKA